ncbi:MAG: ABC transporter transmembrane domain-containing protein, partial [Pseudomonadota bacterium]
MAEPIVQRGDDREKSKRLGALRSLVPFVLPYGVTLVAALVALVTTAAISLVLPLAVRRVVDGFETSAAELLDGYFLAALGIAGLMAVGSGLRFYLVTRLGERVVADIRRAVFDRMIGMSPAFYEKIMTGEVLSRITTDTTLLLGVIGSSISVALRNMLMLIGGLIMLFYSAPKLAALVLLIVPVVIVPIIVLGRRLRKLSAQTQDLIAASSGNASEALLSVQTVQAFTHETASRGTFADITERSFSATNRRILMRSLMTVIVIMLIFSGIVGVLWIGARDVRADVMTVGELVQFVIYAIIVAGGAAALSEIWGELQRAAGATERLVELLNSEDTVN